MGCETFSLLCTHDHSSVGTYRRVKSCPSTVDEDPRPWSHPYKPWFVVSSVVLADTKPPEDDRP